MPKASVYWRLFRALAENPRFFLFTLRGGVHARVAKQLARGVPPAPGSFHPVKLDLRLVYACNLRCKMCGQWGDTGTFFDYAPQKLRQRLSRAVIEGVVDELAPHGLRYVDLEGGETFLHPEILDILAALKRRRLFVKPVTNGTHLEKFADDLVALGIDAIHVSVDGDREAHNAVRGFDWAYDRTLEGLSALAEARRRRGRHGPLIQISFTLSRHNRAEALRRLCRDLDGRGLVDVISVKATPIWIPKEKGEEYQKLLERWFGPDAKSESWKGFVEDYADFAPQAREIVDAVRDLERAGYDFWVDHLPGIDPAEIPRLYAEHGWDLGRSHCAIPWVEPTIEPDGQVYPCNLFTDPALAMGNVNDTPFLEIWFGEKFESFRRMITAEGGLLPICTRCCQLTEA